MSRTVLKRRKKIVSISNDLAVSINSPLSSLQYINPTITERPLFRTEGSEKIQNEVAGVKSAANSEPSSETSESILYNNLSVQQMFFPSISQRPRFKQLSLHERIWKKNGRSSAWLTGHPSMLLLSPVETAG